MQELTILKIGGNVIDHTGLLSLMLDSFAGTKGNKILVHGGGKIASEIMKNMGIEPKMADGRRITDEKTLEIVTMVYGGLINKNIVCQLQARHCNAIGLTGADAGIIPAQKRPIKQIDYGFVGDVTSGSIHTNALIHMLSAGWVPVFAPLTHDGAGSMLNTNADTIASSLAVALSSNYHVKLIYCLEKNGVLSDPNNDDSVLPQIDENLYNTYKTSGAIHSGMIPKLDNAFDALKSGVTEIVICGPGAFNKQNANSGTSIHL